MSGNVGPSLEAVKNLPQLTAAETKEFKTALKLTGEKITKLTEKFEKEERVQGLKLDITALNNEKKENDNKIAQINDKIARLQAIKDKRAAQKAQLSVDQKV